MATEKIDVSDWLYNKLTKRPVCIEDIDVRVRCEGEMMQERREVEDKRTNQKFMKDFDVPQFRPATAEEVKAYLKASESARAERQERVKARKMQDAQIVMVAK